MASLYKRAQPHQRLILRIVEGAVKNTADHHPEMQYSPRMARSIAKRAAGTLSAQLAETLAGPTGLVRQPGAGHFGLPAGPLGPHPVTTPEPGRGDSVHHPIQERGAAHRCKPHPNLLPRIIKQISTKVAAYKRCDDPISKLTADGLIEALRIIAAVREKPNG